MDENKNEPTAANDAPFWFNPDCGQMLVARFDKNSRILDIAGDTASVRIILLDASVGERWRLKWSVALNSVPSESSLIFTSRQLRAAFGVSLNLGSGSTPRLTKEPFCAEVGQEGLFIRRGLYLNIPDPCAGANRDADPNVSIKLTEEITNAVRELIRP